MLWKYSKLYSVNEMRKKALQCQQHQHFFPQTLRAHLVIALQIKFSLQRPRKTLGTSSDFLL